MPRRKPLDFDYAIAPTDRDALAAALLADPDTGFCTPFAKLPGYTHAAKTARLVADLKARGVAVTHWADEELLTMHLKPS